MTKFKEFLKHEPSITEWCYLDGFWFQDCFGPRRVSEILNLLVSLDRVRNSRLDEWVPEYRYVNDIHYPNLFDDIGQFYLASDILLNDPKASLTFRSFYEMKEVLNSFNERNFFFINQDLKNFKGGQSIASFKHPQGKTITIAKGTSLRDIYGSFCLAFGRLHGNDYQFFNGFYSNMERKISQDDEDAVNLLMEFLSRYGLDDVCYDFKDIKRTLPFDVMELDFRRLNRIAMLL